MIFPILNGLLRFSKAPITWCLVFLNVFVMLYGSLLDINAVRRLTEIAKDKTFIEIQGAIYQAYLREHEGHQIQRDLAAIVEEDSITNQQILGVLAFRDEGFLETAGSELAYTDEVALAYWKKKSDQFLNSQRKSLSYLLGVNSSNFDVPSWFSYMFAHGNWMHLFSNMVFLILVGCTLELMLGSLPLLIVYLLSGFIGCGFYILLSGLSASPLIGASGAVSGLISMLAVLNWNQPIRFVYWLMLPRKDALGFVYFPGFVLFFVWLIADFSGWLSSSSLFGGVAHSAHLGGHLAGALAAFGLILYRYFRGQPKADPAHVQMYQLYPLSVSVNKLPDNLTRLPSGQNPGA